MQIDLTLLGVYIPLILGLFGLAYGYGALNNRVKTYKQIEDERQKAHSDDINDIWKHIDAFKRENKEDHKEMGIKLDTIIRNGKGG